MVPRFVEAPLSFSNAMISLAIKVKYFPNGDFINSKLGHSPSYSSRSIWHSRVLVKEGLKWSIGDGSNIHVFNDPW